MPTSPIQHYFERRLKRPTSRHAIMSSSSPATARGPSAYEDSPEMVHLDAIVDHEKYSMEGSDATSDSLLGEKDLESQDRIPTTLQPTAPVEYQVSLTRKLVFLGLYFILNLGLTLSNKAVMQRARLPWLLTVMHASATSFGCCALAATGHLKLTRLGVKEHLVLVAFSSLFTLNIAVSNVSL